MVVSLATIAAGAGVTTGVCSLAHYAYQAKKTKANSRYTKQVAYGRHTNENPLGKVALP